MTKTRKNLPWSGWKQQKPGFHQKTVMLKKCGKKCFLGTRKSFPICKKNTCTISKKGVYAAYVRAREYSSRTGKRKYKNVVTRAKKILKHK